MTKDYFAVFKNDLNEISRLGAVLEGYGKENSLSNELINTMNLVLDELITNTISYGYNDNVEHEIRLSLSIEGPYLCARLEDDALAFNPLDAPEADTGKPLEEKQIGGLGLHLVRKLTDSFSYQRLSEKNYTEVKKKIV